jgi:hypothetical protein
MMRYSIREVQDWGERWQVLYDVEQDDGTFTTHGHCFPKDTMESRAAEYGIDPSETETLLDIVLAEGFFTQEDVAAGEELYAANTIEEARQAHLARCARVKLRIRLTTRPTAAARKAQTEHPLDPVRLSSPMEADVIQLKREFVAQRRMVHRREIQRRREQNERLALLPRRERVRRALQGNGDSQ